MKKLSFPTVKLGNFIREVKEKVKSSSVSQDDFTVYGVTNTDGITVTNNKVSDDLSNYTVLKENQFVYNPYRVNVGSIGLSLPGTFGAVSPAYVVFETNGQISNEFLLYYLKSSLGINLIKWYGDHGGVRSALRFSDLKKIDFPDITLEQQNKLLMKIKKLDELLYELYKNLSADKIKTLRQSKLIEMLTQKRTRSIVSNVIEEMIVSEKLEQIFDILNHICEGNLTKQEDGYFYTSAKYDAPIALSNISTGFKTFLILKTLLMNGAIEEGGTIILDEPEIHLHPEWQLVFAELIVLIHKEFGIHVLLNTHSPYFLNAIEVYAVKHGIDDKCKYYLASSNAEVSNIEDVTNNIEAICRKIS